MRVISGAYKGRALAGDRSGAIRATAERVKEAMFSALGDATDAVAVDLFAGTGALGIEALSRGAKKVYFCDASPAALRLVARNARFLPRDSFEILRGAYSDCLARLSRRGVAADLIFCDPPYGRIDLGEIADRIARSAILRPGGLLATERRVGDPAQRRIFAFLGTRTYGSVATDLHRNVSKCAVTGSFDPFTLGHLNLVNAALERFGFCYVALMDNADKIPTYSHDVRLRIMRSTLAPLRDRARVEYHPGLCVDYCRANGLKCVVRGIRDAADEAYERDMAEHNLREGGIETIFVRVADGISSVEAKRLWAMGADLRGIVAESAIWLLDKKSGV